MGSVTPSMDLWSASATDLRSSRDKSPIVQGEPTISIPPHSLGVKPSGNQYAATSNARHAIGLFRILPDELIGILLEYFGSSTLMSLGSTCKFLSAFCRVEDLWKALFIE